MFQANYRGVKLKDTSKQEAYWDKMDLIHILYLKYGYRINSFSLTLVLVMPWMGGRTWLVTHEFFYFLFCCCTLPITQQPLGEPEPLVNKSLMWELQSPRQQNRFSLILHVFLAKKPVSLDTTARGDLLLACSPHRKADQGGIKWETYVTSFHITYNAPLYSTTPACTKGNWEELNAVNTVHFVPD